MFQRKYSKLLKECKDKYKAIALLGPRQSGKTTLSKYCFPEYEYFSLENPDTRMRAQEDPRQFLGSIKSNCILDEIQNTPELLSYLQEILDSKLDNRKFILTGSNSFQINEKISQSLAGRVRIVTILPLLPSEIPIEQRTTSLDQALYTGLYPRIFNESLSPETWYADYYNTYIQKDVRSLLAIKDMLQFDRFIRVCAGRVACISEYSSMASEVGISQPTAVSWSSVLESSYLIFRLQPHFKNFNKRIIKSPKIYFYDTGLLCYLLRIQSPDQLATHPLRAAIFENWVVSILQKIFICKGKEAPTYFWRDQHGHEVDILLDKSSLLFPIEIKSGSTFTNEWIKTLNWFSNLQGTSDTALIYGGTDLFKFKECSVISWSKIEEKVEEFL
ncbi:MAG TPA: ATP-binding protein [Oligoflexia bacterium]|nr:ATP-binding protein [Oligoflexia bacterium]HMP47795.1 ATP-binding protein [Oligoflexia bacterium]